MPSAILGTPICHEDIEFAGLFGVSIRDEDEFLTLWTEHGKRIKPRMKCNSLQSRPVGMDEVETEFPTLGLMEV